MVWPELVVLVRRLGYEPEPLYDSFPLKSPADAKAVAGRLPPLMPDLFKAQDSIGTIHYSRFTVLSEKTLLFLGDFDGEFGELMSELAKSAGPVFDEQRGVSAAL